MSNWIACKGCKYDDNGECTFYIMGSGNEIEKPCYREEELVNRAAKDFLDTFLERGTDGLYNQQTGGIRSDREIGI